MKPVSQRNKSNVERGKRGEREFRRIIVYELGDVIDNEITRNLDQSRDSGSDFICIPGWSIECRNRPSVVYTPGWMREAIDRAVPGTKPALAYRLPNRPVKDRWWLEVRAGDLFPYLKGTASGENETVHMKYGLWFTIVREMISHCKVVKPPSSVSFDISAVSFDISADGEIFKHK